MTPVSKEKFEKTLKTVDIGSNGSVSYNYDGSTFKLMHTGGTINMDYSLTVKKTDGTKIGSSQNFTTKNSWTKTWTGCGGGDVILYYHSKTSGASDWQNTPTFTLSDTWETKWKSI